MRLGKHGLNDCVAVLGYLYLKGYSFCRNTFNIVEEERIKKDGTICES